LSVDNEKDILLSVKNLKTYFYTEDGVVKAVDGVDFYIRKGETLGMVGESGCGKSVTALSVMRLVPNPPGKIVSGEIMFSGEDLLKKNEVDMRKIRGNKISMIFQEPMTSLNPVYTIGDQIIEAIMLHQKLSKQDALKKAIEMLNLVGIPEPAKRVRQYPHELSGGMRQRAMIAMALSCNPDLLIADEPTTALDVTIQMQIIELLEELQKEFQMAILLISHDLNLVRRFADNICVMQNGSIVEQKNVNDLFSNPEHSYTKKLLSSQPEKLITNDSELNDNDPLLLEGEKIRCYFPIKTGFFNKHVGDIKAVDDVDIKLKSGETLGIVGESGSGKTTLGMCLLRLQECDGIIKFDQKNIHHIKGKSLRLLRNNFQVVFQDPFASLSPRMTIAQILVEGLNIHFPDLSSEEKTKRIHTVLSEVDLLIDILWRYPHEFSGGQRQRIAIARVLVLEPKLILLDEPTSALDVSTQKQVLELLRKLQVKHNISYILISHDLAVVRAMAHQLIIMNNGQVVEQGNTEKIFSSPEHDYTRILMKASEFSKSS